MADGDRQLAFTTGPVPTSVQVSGPDRVTPKTVNASFDGTGAAGAFLPCLIITGRTGLEVARIPAPQVAAGASAEVSWFPRVGGATSSGGGIAFDTDNEGGWLDVTTNARDANFLGMDLKDTSGGGILIESTPGPVNLHGPENNTVELNTDGSINITTDGAGDAPTISIDADTDLTLSTVGGRVEVSANGLGPGGEEGVLIEAHNPDFGAVIVQSDGTSGITIQATDGGSGAGVVQVAADDGAIFVGNTLTPHASLQMQSATYTGGADELLAVLGTGGSFTVYTHSGHPVFQVRDDGSVHIKTGTAIIADL